MSGPTPAHLMLAALQWYEAGACILPVAADGTKRPALRWDAYQSQRPTMEETGKWAAGAVGIGMVCGQVSGNVEMLEAESAAIADDLHSILLASLSKDLMDKLLTYVEVSPSGGMHWIFRVEGVPVKKNTKLARRRTESNAIQVLFETRGEGGWTVLSPSGGAAHPSGKSWAMVAGCVPGKIATLTAEEYELVHAVAATFDEMPEPEIVIPPPSRVTLPGDSGLPGEDFEQRASWEEILIPAGWQVFRHRGEVTDWTRPGKSLREGVSATTGWQGDWFYPFTTSTEFEAGRTYTKFGTYAILNHGGDHAAAASDLRKLGYGAPPPVTRKLTLVSGAGEEPGAPGVAGGPMALMDSHQEPITISTSLTDDGNALLLASIGQPILRYCADRAAWLTWRQTHWQWDPDQATAVELMRNIIRRIDPKDKLQAVHQVRSLGKRAIYDAVKLASSDPNLSIRIDQLDSAPMVLNTPGGVVDLATGIITDQVPADYHTKITKVTPDFEAAAPRWMAFLSDTFGDDHELLNFVQRVMGYSATGKVTHQILPFCHGSGGNGKTVFLETCSKVLGDYAGTAPADFLLANGKDETYAVADLVGKRLVICSEVEAGARFAEQKVKQLTGGDSITARFMRQNYFTFTPSHHLWLLGNHEPRVSAGGEGFWRRLRKIPFTVQVPEDKKIPDLQDIMAEEEGPAILAWIVNGARAQINGLAEPEAVLTATAAYAAEEDHIGRFMSERVHLGGDPALVRLESKKLYSAYLSWCSNEGIKPMAAHVFGRELRSRGIDKKSSNGRNFYVSLTLLNSEFQNDDAPEQTRFDT